MLFIGVSVHLLKGGLHSCMIIRMIIARLSILLMVITALVVSSVWTMSRRVKVM